MQISTEDEFNKSPLKDEINKEFDKGIMLYMGDIFLQIDENMYAVPIGFLK